MLGLYVMWYANTSDLLNYPLDVCVRAMTLVNKVGPLSVIIRPYDDASVIIAGCRSFLSKIPMDDVEDTFYWRVSQCARWCYWQTGNKANRNIVFVNR